MLYTDPNEPEPWSDVIDDVVLTVVIVALIIVLVA
jgi:hypothetical protein